MSKWFHVIVLALPALLAACTSDTPSSEPRGSANATSFYIIGDTPYSAEDEVMLAEAVSKLQTLQPPFVIHIGDYKGGRALCTPEHDTFHADLIESLAPIPVFYTPGDNEWTDCDRHVDPATNIRFSDLDRLDKIRELFFSEPPRTGSVEAFSQQDQIPENQTWVLDNIRFVTLHVTGTNNGRDWVTGDPLERALDAVTLRDTQNSEWLDRAFNLASDEASDAVVIAMQADPTDIKKKPADVMCATVASNSDHACDAFTNLRAQIRDRALAYEKPVLLIHGDTDAFTFGQSFMGEEAPNLWRLNAAGDKGPNYGVRDITRVDIDLTQSPPFSAQGVLTGRKPKRR